jgi:pseudouridine 5'-phosphatase
LQCLVIEDSPNGVQAGISAGMQVMMVPGDAISDEQKSKATIAIKSLEDFTPELFGLPPY